MIFNIFDKCLFNRNLTKRIERIILLLKIHIMNSRRISQRELKDTVKATDQFGNSYRNLTKRIERISPTVISHHPTPQNLTKRIESLYTFR